MHRAARIAATCFFVFHIGAITMSNVSRDTELGTGFHRPFEWYLTLANLWQTWDMFITIPHFAGMRGVLVGVDEHGQAERYGPMLPGLRPYLPEHRINGTFMRLAFSSNEYPGFADRYLAGVCRALAETLGSPPEKVGFELTVLELRPLSEVRRDRRIAAPKVLRFGPTTCIH